MQVTRAADNAVRVMIHLASLPPGSRTTRDALARAADVRPEFLSKVLQALARHGLILSYRGPVGGFELARPPESISVLDVVEAIDGPIALNRCVQRATDCGRAAWCAGHSVWQRAQEAMVTVLRDATIDRLAAETAENLAAAAAGPFPEDAWS